MAKKKEAVDAPVSEVLTEPAKKDNAYWKERVPYVFPRQRNKRGGQPDVIISVNGKSWQIQRGKEVMIPRYALKAYMETQAMIDEAEDYIEATANKK